MGHPHAPFFLPRVWQLTPALFVSGLVLMHSKDPSSISRILDIAQEMKVHQCLPLQYKMTLLVTPIVYVLGSFTNFGS